MKKLVAVIIPLVLLALVYSEELSLFWSFESGSGIWTVAASANGERIAAGSWDHNVYFFDARGNMLWEFKTNGPVWSVASSADSSAIAVGSGDKNVYLLNSAGSAVWKYSAQDTVWSVAISAKGDSVAAGSYDDNVYYFKDGQPLWKYTTKDDVLSVAMSGDGEYVAAGSWDQKVYFFDSSGALLWEYHTEGIVSAVALSRDGRFVVAGSNDNRIYTFDRTGKLLGKYRLSSDVLAVGVSADGRYAAAGSRDGGIYIFTIPQGASASESASGLTGKYQAKDEVWSVALSADGSRIAAASLDNNVYVLDNKAQLIGKYETGSRVTSVAITSDGKRVSAGSYDNRVYFLNIETTTPPPVKVEEPPNLKATRTITPSSLTEGEYTTVKIEVANIGGSKAVRVSIIDSIPEGFKMVGGEDTWLSELNPGETTTITYTLLALETGKTAVYELPKLHMIYEDNFGTVYHAFGDAIPLVVLAKPKPVVPPPVEEAPIMLPVPPETIVRVAASLFLATILVLALVAILRPRITDEYRLERISLIKQLKGEVQGYAVGVRPLATRVAGVAPRPAGVGIAFLGQPLHSLAHAIEVAGDQIGELTLGVLTSMNKVRLTLVGVLDEVFGVLTKRRAKPEGRALYRYHKKGLTIVDQAVEGMADAFAWVTGMYTGVKVQAARALDQLSNIGLGKGAYDILKVFREGTIAILSQLKDNVTGALKAMSNAIANMQKELTSAFTKLRPAEGRIPYRYHKKGITIISQMKQDLVDISGRTSVALAGLMNLIKVIFYRLGAGIVGFFDEISNIFRANVYGKAIFQLKGSLANIIGDLPRVSDIEAKIRAELTGVLVKLGVLGNSLVGIKMYLSGFFHKTLVYIAAIGRLRVDLTNLIPKLRVREAERIPYRYHKKGLSTFDRLKNNAIKRIGQVFHRLYRIRTWRHG